MKYCYIELCERLHRRERKNGTLWFVGEPSVELIEELELEAEYGFGSKGIDETKIMGYKTDLKTVGEKGWELLFVTPCGLLQNKGNDREAGAIENSYIFKKEIQGDQ